MQSPKSSITNPAYNAFPDCGIGYNHKTAIAIRLPAKYAKYDIGKFQIFGEKLVICYSQSLIDVWDISDCETPRLLHQLTGFKYEPHCLALHDDTLLASSGGQLAYWELSKLRTINKLTPNLRKHASRQRANSMRFISLRSSQERTTNKPRKLTEEQSLERDRLPIAPAPSPQASPRNSSQEGELTGGNPTYTFAPCRDDITHILVLESGAFMTAHTEHRVMYWSNKALFPQQETQLKGPILALTLSTQNRPLIAVHIGERICVYTYETYHHETLTSSYPIRINLKQCNLYHTLLDQNGNIMLYYYNQLTRECWNVHYQEQIPQAAVLINRKLDCLNEERFCLMPNGNILTLIKPKEKGAPILICAYHPIPADEFTEALTTRR